NNRLPTPTVAVPRMAVTVGKLTRAKPRRMVAETSPSKFNLARFRRGFSAGVQATVSVVGLREDRDDRHLPGYAGHGAPRPGPHLYPHNKDVPPSLPAAVFWRSNFAALQKR